MRPLPRRLLIVAFALVVLLLAARLALPSFLKRQINRRLSQIPGYAGHVDSVGVKLWHGGYTMQKFVIQKRDAGLDTEPFVAADNIEFSIAYRRLLHGQLVSDVEIDGGQINFITTRAPEQKQNLGLAAGSPGEAPKPDRRWQTVVQDLFPIDITHLELHESRIHYIDETAKPRIDLAIDHMELDASGLRDRPEKNGPPLPATVNLTGETIGRGHLHLYVAAEPLALQPHFQLKVSLANVDLTALNGFLLAYANVDVSKGRFQLYCETSGSGGSYHGYVKPFFTDLDFKTRSDEKKNPFQLLWKDLVAATARLMRDKENKQVATIIPFSGTFQQGTSVRVMPTIGNLIHNGFIAALRRGLEGSSSVTSEKPPADLPSPPNAPSNANPPTQG
ncbi:MAG TPA: DUF748 domain-containing protein [Opitutaceae bacterium]|jgi:hypothetical protein